MREIVSPLSGFGSPFGGRKSFNPIRLFRAGEQGVWFEPSPTTCFTDTAGTTPAQVGQAVALMLDKSRGLALGPELGNAALLDKRPATDGTVTRSGGIITFTSAASGLSVAISQEITGLTVGRTYRFNGRMRRTVGTTVCVPQIRTADGGGGSGLLTGPLIGSDFTSFSLLWVATQTSAHFSFSAGATSQTIEVDEAAFSVRELPGNHATQSITSARPILARVPASGRVNLLTRTEEFDNAVWTLVGASISANATTAPDGTTTADKLVENTSNSQHAVVVASASRPTIPAGNHTHTVYVKADGRTSATLYNNGTSGGAGVAFNLTTGTVTQVGGTQYVSSTISDAGNGWYRLSLTFLALSGTAALTVYLGSVFSGEIYTGDGSSGVFIWGAQLELGSTATNYQKVTDQFDVTEAGQPDNFYLSFDGIDDSMSTPSIDFTGTDKMSVFAGVRKLSDGALGVVVELSAITSVTNPGSFNLLLPASTVTLGANDFQSAGTLFASARAVLAAPITAIVAGIGDISGDNAALRVGGTQVAQSTADQGTGNYGNYSLFIGARDNASLRFNGQIYSLIVRGAQTDTPTIERTEKYVASKTAGVSL